MFHDKDNKLKKEYLECVKYVRNNCNSYNKSFIDFMFYELQKDFGQNFYQCTKNCKNPNTLDLPLFNFFLHFSNSKESSCKTIHNNYMDYAKVLDEMVSKNIVKNNPPMPLPLPVSLHPIKEKQNVSELDNVNTEERNRVFCNDQLPQELQKEIDATRNTLMNNLILGYMSGKSSEEIKSFYEEFIDKSLSEKPNDKGEFKYWSIGSIQNSLVKVSKKHNCNYEDVIISKIQDFKKDIEEKLKGKDIGDLIVQKYLIDHKIELLKKDGIKGGKLAKILNDYRDLIGGRYGLDLQAFLSLTEVVIKKKNMERITIDRLKNSTFCKAISDYWSRVENGINNNKNLTESKDIQDIHQVINKTKRDDNKCPDDFTKSATEILKKISEKSFYGINDIEKFNNVIDYLKYSVQNSNKESIDKKLSQYVLNLKNKENSDPKNIKIMLAHVTETLKNLMDANGFPSLKNALLGIGFNPNNGAGNVPITSNDPNDIKGKANGYIRDAQRLKQRNDDNDRILQSLEDVYSENNLSVLWMDMEKFYQGGLDDKYYKNRAILNKPVQDLNNKEIDNAYKLFKEEYERLQELHSKVVAIQKNVLIFNKYNQLKESFVNFSDNSIKAKEFEKQYNYIFNNLNKKLCEKIKKDLNDSLVSYASDEEIKYNLSILNEGITKKCSLLSI